MRAESVFFDVDGTLHGGDVFEAYVIHMLKRSLLRLLILFPLSLLALLMHLFFPDRRAGLSLLMWVMTFMVSEESLLRSEHGFAVEFAGTVASHKQVLRVLQGHIEEGNYVYLVSGSPEMMVKSMYPAVSAMPNVIVIGSRFERFLGGRVIAVRCVMSEKVRQIERRVGHPVAFKAGYSDSWKDRAVLSCCEEAYKVDAAGQIGRWLDERF
ncbi:MULTISPECIES: haloacid dehalogenase-like hydrolase [Stenotrophomonas]|jgi:phosphatidylglycerophosphatase C|uniref:haloacid dehalogenase-like hydrolase n=1 Tax=Stenotrophomonas sp. CFBP8994 TaxID=3096527 RepID=UPI002A6B7A85|nr:haloacid dehalogenase-like hydrolase [Stenotrophomonas sp. CFBP8994]MDY0978719.1 haloacid dehalogenase-like hydrolase [Stenotrophomonas sp. CFBP8994]